MAKIVKNAIGNFLITCLILATMTAWFYVGKPQIWQNPVFPPEIQEVYALSATKTWVFDVDAEGLADGAGSAFIIFAWDDPDNAVNFFMDKKDKTDETEYARKTSTGDTWETWGVPSGSTVTAVQITAWQEKTVNNTGLTSHTISARIIGSGGATVHSAGDLLVAVDPGTGIDATYQAGAAGTERAVDSGSQALTTDVRLELQYVMTTGATPNINQRFDTIELTMTYTSVTYSVVVQDGIVTYGNVATGATNDTTTGGVAPAQNDQQHAGNNGTGAETFNIRGAATSDPDLWDLVTTVPTGGQYRHRFATQAAVPYTWYGLTSNYQTLEAGIAQGATQDFHLEIMMSDNTAITTQQNVNVTVQATQ